jgi:hypothetical protein
MRAIAPTVVGLTALQALACAGSAISQAAHTICRTATEVVGSVERSQALFGEKSSALAALAVLEAEHAVRGWDNDGAEPINPIAAAAVKRFVRVLPDGVQLPEFAAEPDGSISLDWISSPTRLFSLSVGRGDRLAYAWLDGSDKGHGVAHFDGQTIPARVLEGIQGIVGRHAPVRAA